MIDRKNDWHVELSRHLKVGDFFWREPQRLLFLLRKSQNKPLVK